MASKRLTALLLTLTLCWASNIQAQMLSIRYRQSESTNDARDSYFLTLLNMALEETRHDYGSFDLIRSETGTSHQRAFELVSSGQGLDIFWGMSSTRREHLAHAVPFPLMRGLLAVRVPLVPKNKTQIFNDISSVRKLSALTAVQGAGWPDTRILRHNGLPVLTSSRYESLFDMLRRGRADYFPRSVMEVWGELNSPLGQGLSISSKLLLVYKGPIYFFVHKDNHALAERLQVGLERLWNSGRFNSLFFSRPEIRKALALINNRGYKVIRLSAPWRLPSLDKVLDAYWLPLPAQARDQRR